MTNAIKILGAHGSRAKGFGTSSFYLNATNVIDAGNLLNTLQDSCAEIENIWLTHSHLDHIADIAYILDNYYSKRKKPLNIMGLAPTLNAIKKHFLNDLIWPDFSKIKLHKSDEMCVTYTNIIVGNTYTLSETEYIKAIKTDHTVPSCGYVYTKNKSSIIISADTYSLEEIIKEIDENSSIVAAVVECSFASNMKQLARESKHMTPKILFEELKKLKKDGIKLYINHMKPIFLEKITNEIAQNRGKYEMYILKDEEIINF
ncbi:MAG: MBL fold metallo-hydrolase [Sulfurimonas sp.]|nr:MBL fold metallo-hydrolase [Sulfurimonas sp.]